MIPFVDLKAQYESIKPDIDAAMKDVIETSAFIRGHAAESFEKEFAACIGIEFALGVASGTDALHIATRALDLGPGDEVIVQANTWISTAYAASYVGATPVFVDVDPETYQIDLAELEKAITPKTKAVIPAHMFGHPAPMNRIVEICRQRDIKIIEDIAQAPLAAVNGSVTGTFGDVACFSFYPSKNLGCYGDGGAVVTGDGDLFRKMKMLADYGQAQRFDHRLIGYNSRLDTLQAAILLAKLPHLGAWTEARRAHAKRYNDLLEDLPIVTPAEAPNTKAVYHLYVVQTDRRDECLDYLRDHEIMAQIHYPSTAHLQPCYAGLGYRKGDLPVAEKLAGRILSLPMYPELTDAQIQTVAETLKSFFARNA